MSIVEKYLVFGFALLGVSILFGWIVNFLFRASEEARENKKHIEYGMLLITILSVVFAGISLYQSMQSNEKLKALEQRVTTLQNQVSSPSATLDK